MKPVHLLVQLALLLGAGAAEGQSPAPHQQQRLVIPSWDVQSSAHAPTDNLSALSLSGGVDTSSWHHAPVSRCTLMGCLLAAGVYDDRELFFSDNLATKVDARQFAVPWLYRSEFALGKAAGKHYFLETNGITPRADVWLDGREVANSSVQAGAYAGLVFDVTDALARGDRHALVVRVYPTDVNYDLAVGFVDWNPAPPDNSTGVWRDVLVRETGPVALGPLRVVTDFELPAADGTRTNKSARVTLRAEAQNLEGYAVTVVAAAHVSAADDDKSRSYMATRTVELGPLQSVDLDLEATVDDAALWWPHAWGEQPLYEAQLSVSVNGSCSDAVSKRFGIRRVTRALNGHNDTLFSVNGQPMQVRGAGYAPDMFLRWDARRFEAQARYALDLGLNAVRLEGKLEQPGLYATADALGLMVLAGWECCDKWEAWPYNEDVATYGDARANWTGADYGVAAASMRHEAAVLQGHPSVLGFLVGSDYWPDKRATGLYLGALKGADWQDPVVASAAMRGWPEALGPSGMKMAGPYDWVPPNYWYDTAAPKQDQQDRLGAAFGFGSELGAGVGTPELGSLRKFLSEGDMADLWRNVSGVKGESEKALYHMSAAGSSFATRQIYDAGLRARYGPAGSLDEYVLKAQMADYEATRAQFEAYGARWVNEDLGGKPDGSTDAVNAGSDRSATGLVYWMLNNAWPGLHWALFDHYLRPAGAYFGAKTGGRGPEHVVYDYVRGEVWVINRSLDRRGGRTVRVDVVDAEGMGVVVRDGNVSVATVPNTSRKVCDLKLDSKLKNGPDGGRDGDVMFLRLLLLSGNGDGDGTSVGEAAKERAETRVLSRNVYWLPRNGRVDALDWANSTWYHTPVTRYVDLTGLDRLAAANVSASASRSDAPSGPQMAKVAVTLRNHAPVPAVFLRLRLVDLALGDDDDVAPVFWSDNYVTLWPGEEMALAVEYRGHEAKGARLAVRVSGKNVASADYAVSG